MSEEIRYPDPTNEYPYTLSNGNEIIVILDHGFVDNILVYVGDDDEGNDAYVQLPWDELVARCEDTEKLKERLGNKN